MNAKKFIDEAISLPVEERVFIIDSLLRTLNQPEPDIDDEWGMIAQKRLEEMRSGKVKPIPGKEVFRKIRERFE